MKIIGDFFFPLETGVGQGFLQVLDEGRQDETPNLGLSYGLSYEESLSGFSGWQSYNDVTWESPSLLLTGLEGFWVTSYQVFSGLTTDLSDQYYFKCYLKSGRNQTDLILSMDQTIVHLYPLCSGKTGKPVLDVSQATRTVDAPFYQYLLKAGKS